MAGGTRRRAKLYLGFAREGQRIELLRRDSHDAETVRRVQRLVAARGIDLLFIDGDHSYEGVKQDYLTYAPLVLDGGLIVLHDIVPGDDENVGGVPRLWRELKRGTEVEELVADWDQGGYGLGLLRRRPAQSRSASP